MDEDWFDEFHRSVSSTLELLSEKREYSTPAETGLVLSVLSDYFEDESNIERDLHVIRIAAEILDAKHTTPEISWFDIYDTVIMNFTNISWKNNSMRETENISCDSLEDIVRELDNFDVESPHTKEYANGVSHLVNCVTSSEAKQLSENNPHPELDDTEDFSQFSHGLSTKSGFQYGAVEIPNNVYRMRLTEITKTIQSADLDDRDMSWVLNQLKQWLTMYARAEATIADRNISHQELREFMIEHETPAERYW